MNVSTGSPELGSGRLRRPRCSAHAPCSPSAQGQPKFLSWGQQSVAPVGPLSASRGAEALSEVDLLRAELGPSPR